MFSMRNHGAGVNMLALYIQPWTTYFQASPHLCMVSESPHHHVDTLSHLTPLDRLAG